MQPIAFKGHTTTFAKDQPEYIPLPAHKDADGRVTFCWKFTWKERLKLLFSGALWHQVLTFNHPLQPQKLIVDKPELVN